MTIGEKIKEIRILRNMTQKELGEAVGLTATRIGHYEMNFRKPKSDTLKSIANALGVNVEVLKSPNFDNITAMHRLFQLFRQYEGTFDQNGHLYFKKLDLQSWYNRWKLYKDDLAMAQKIPDEKASKYAIENVENKFSWWMETYPESV